MQIEHLIPDLIDILKSNDLLKVVAPAGSGKTIGLAKRLGSFGYDVKVITKFFQFTHLKFENVEYLTNLSLKNWKNTRDKILILDELDTLSNLLFLADWKKNGKNVKLLITSITKSFPYIDGPVLTLKRRSPIEIRYINKNTDLVSLVSNADKMMQDGKFLIFSPLTNLTFNTKREIFVTNDSKILLNKPDFVCIFDTMKDNENNYISKSEAYLRASRSSISTIVYRFISKEKFDTLKQDIPVQLHQLMLDIYEKNLNPFDIFSNITNEVNSIYQIFLNFHLLDASGKITSKGKLVRKLPFGLKSSILALEGYEALVLAALIENYKTSPFIFDINPNESIADYEMDSNVHIRKFYNKFRGESDVETLLYIYINSLSMNQDSLKDWCEMNKISYKYMKNVYKSIESANTILNFPKTEIDMNNFIHKIDSTITKLSQKMYLNQDKTIFTQYVDSDNMTYNVNNTSINLIEEKRPLELYPIIIDNDRIVLSYVSPKTEYQEFKETVIVF